MALMFKRSVELIINAHNWPLKCDFESYESAKAFNTIKCINDEKIINYFLHHGHLWFKDLRVVNAAFRKESTKRSVWPSNELQSLCSCVICKGRSDESDPDGAASHRLRK